MYCQNCGFQTQNAKRCTACFSNPLEYKNYCNICGRKIDIIHSICPYCVKNVSTEKKSKLILVFKILTVFSFILSIIFFLCFIKEFIPLWSDLISYNYKNVNSSEAYNYYDPFFYFSKFVIYSLIGFFCLNMLKYVKR